LGGAAKVGSGRPRERRVSWRKKSSGTWR
jgi:hypothetical protein